MPLVPVADADSPPLGDKAERARKILPQLSRGELRRVAVARHLAEAELLQGILLEEGIPSVLRRSGGFDVPDFLAAGPRDVLVPESGVDAARRLLSTEGGGERLGEDGPDDSPGGRALRLAAGMLVVLLVLGALTGLILALAP